MTSNRPPNRPILPGPLGRLAARVYGAEVARRNRRFDAGQGVTRLPIPVISIGNLSVGGTGKTPLVMHAAETLIGFGLQPCIAMRGYRARDGESDEAAEYGRRLPAVPVVAQPDRTAGLLALLASERGRTIGVALLDDGFQHRRLARDLDIVLLDATRDPFQDRLLPAGWLREPVESLRRAHAVVITHAESVTPQDCEAIARRARAINSRLAVAVARHHWSELLSSQPASDSHDAADSGAIPPADLAGRSVVVACAIGNPGPFIAAAEAHIGGPIASAVIHRDHDPYKPATIGEIMNGAHAADADYILTTEKDWSKLQRVPLEKWPCPVLRPRLILKFDSGEAELTRALQAAARGPGRDSQSRPV